MLRGDLVHRIDDLEAANPAADHDDHTGPVAGADEGVLRPGRAVDEVPGLQAAFLALDQENALAGDDEEALLAALAVVHAFLAGADDLDPEAELRPLLLPLEVGVLPALLAAHPRRIARVQHEPAVAVDDQARVDLLQLRLGNAHRGDINREIPSRDLPLTSDTHV